MRSIASFIIRSSAFISKELREILRQTRLMLALVLGPFLILLLFGLGYRNEARTLRAVFVVPPGEQTISQQVEQYGKSLGPQLDFQGVMPNEGEALARLAQGTVDVVAVIPDNIEGRIRDSEQPVVTLYHHEIDPFQASYVEYVAQIYVDELNRRVLRNIAEVGQKEAGTIQEDMQNAKASAHAMNQAFEGGDALQAQTERVKMNRSLDALTLSIGASLGVLQGVEQTMRPNQGDGEDGTASAILSTIEQINANNESLQNTPGNKSNYSEEAARSAQIEQDLDRLDNQLRDFRQVDPRVLVSPFTAKAVSVNNLKLTSSEFFSPGVIVLLLQHLLTTFAALSIVRERNSGTMELFRVSPVTAFETLLGKYISYLFIGSLLAAAISALVVLVLKVPMFGRWENYAIVLLAVMFTSLGIGFFISLVSETTSQSVQYAMLVLLFSIFFSGFFLDLRLMWDQIRFLAYLIPATYGMQMLQGIMFRASAINPFLLAGLVGIGLVMFLVSWLMLRHEMRTR